jgi:transaldolase
MSDLKVKIFADGADTARMVELSKNPLVQGFTTNPTLMRQAGITAYEEFALETIRQLSEFPISFEVFSDDFEEMHEQALHISQWGENVYVKIPITDTKGASTVPLVKELTRQNVKVNVTAIMTLVQIEPLVDILASGPASYVSVFAGRIADAGVDPLPIMKQAVKMLRPCPKAELIWASPREVFNIVQADDIGCQVITVTYDLLKKLASLGRDLDEFSLDTVRMFRGDAVKAGFALNTRTAAASGSGR